LFSFSRGKDTNKCEKIQIFLAFTYFLLTFALMILNNDIIKVVAFDADDTLWDCQTWFDDVEHLCGDLLRPWATQEEVTQGLFATERSNMELLGHGTKAFTISLVENAGKITHGLSNEPHWRSTSSNQDWQSQRVSSASKATTLIVSSLRIMCAKVIKK
jgi:hypothetical protein